MISDAQRKNIASADRRISLSLPSLPSFSPLVRAVFSCSQASQSYRLEQASLTGARGAKSIEKIAQELLQNNSFNPHRFCENKSRFVEMHIKRKREFNLSSTSSWNAEHLGSVI